MDTTYILFIQSMYSRKVKAVPKHVSLYAVIYLMPDTTEVLK